MNTITCTKVVNIPTIAGAILNDLTLYLKVSFNHSLTCCKHLTQSFSK